MQKGFTLFTALVAFILIILALVLTQSMVSTERSVSDIVSSVSEQQEMQAVADLSRADALQVFNYGIRYSIEAFITEEDNYYMLTQGSYGSWDTMTGAFFKDKFGVATPDDDPAEDVRSANFSIRTASHLTTILEMASDTRGFDTSLENNDFQVLQSQLQKTFVTQSRQNEFYEVINCPNGVFETCTGTFYVILDLSPPSPNGTGVSDEDYEKFPLVSVKNQQTGRTLKEPILPRGKFRIYVPVRFFKGLAVAREIGGEFFGENIPRFIPDIAIVGSTGDPTLRVLEETKELYYKGIIAARFPETDGFVVDVSKTKFKINAGIALAPDAPGNPFGSMTIAHIPQNIELDLHFVENNEQYRVSSLNKNEFTIRLQKTLS